MAKSHFPGAETKVLRDMSPFLACNCREMSGLHHHHHSSIFASEILTGASESCSMIVRIRFVRR